MTISVRDLQKTFGHNGTLTAALQDINLEIAAGEFVSVVGPTGCGKSTLLHIVAGLDHANGGTVTVGGKLVTGPGTERVAVFQDPSLFPWLTVRDNVEFGLKVRGVPPEERRERAFHYLKMVHLARFSEHLPKQLSGGMRQRASIARALAMDAEILLMDEPFAALDAQTRIVLVQEVQEIWLQTRKTVVFVTHNLDEALLLSDRIVLMTAKPGRISAVVPVESGRPRSLGDPYHQRLHDRMMSHLEAEIAKVAREEMDSDWEFTLGRVPRGSDSDLGGGI